MSEILKVCGIAVITIALTAALKAFGSSIVGYITQISAIIIFIGAIGSLVPIISLIHDIASGVTDTNVSVYSLVLAGGLAIIAKVISDLCKENGHEMLKNAVEFAANTEILLLCVPIIRELFKLSTEILQI